MGAKRHSLQAFYDDLLAFVDRLRGSPTPEYAERINRCLGGATGNEVLGDLRAELHALVDEGTAAEDDRRWAEAAIARVNDFLWPTSLDPREPPRGRWWSACVRLVDTYEGRERPWFVDAVFVFRASDQDDAFARALRLGSREQYGGKGSRAKARLAEVLTLDPLDQRIPDGRKVYTRSGPLGDDEPGAGGDELRPEQSRPARMGASGLEPGIWRSYRQHRPPLPTDD